MPERGTEAIRKEIAAERDGLDADLDALQAELRSLVPFVVAGVAAVALITFRKGARNGLKLIWKLV